MIKPQEFQQEIWRFYKEHKRDLPWRNTVDPYQVMVSEVMLQQTQVSRVIDYYKKFLTQFPTVEVLSQARLADVLQIWQGLGYNRRALFLQQAAHKVVKDYRGQLPTTLKELQTLPGVGSNTAGAIMAYAFDKPVVFIETNIRKTIIHFFFSGQEKVSDKEIAQKITETLPGKSIREWYWALVDYGAMLGRTKQVRNNQSSHYRKQSQFQDSKRQLRAIILRKLLDSPSTSDQLAGINHRRAVEIPVVLTELIKEELVIKKGEKFYVR